MGQIIKREIWESYSSRMYISETNITPSTPPPKTNKTQQQLNETIFQGSNRKPCLGKHGFTDFSEIPIYLRILFLPHCHFLEFIGMFSAQHKGWAFAALLVGTLKESYELAKYFS